MTRTPLHMMTLSPQPNMDGWLCVCSCGWRSSMSIYEVPVEEFGDAKRWTKMALIDRHRAHVKQEVPDP